jgi:hypothetical protein
VQLIPRFEGYYVSYSFRARTPPNILSGVVWHRVVNVNAERQQEHRDRVMSSTRLRPAAVAGHTGCLLRGGRFDVARQPRLAHSPRELWRGWCSPVAPNRGQR